MFSNFKMLFENQITNYGQKRKFYQMNETNTTIHKSNQITSLSWEYKAFVFQIDNTRNFYYNKNWKLHSPKSLTLEELIRFVTTHKKDCIDLQIHIDVSSTLKYIENQNRGLLFQQIYSILKEKPETIDNQCNNQPFFIKLHKRYNNRLTKIGDWILYYCKETKKIEIYKVINISDEINLGYAFHLIFLIDCRIYQLTIEQINSLIKQLQLIVLT